MGGVGGRRDTHSAGRWERFAMIAKIGAATAEPGDVLAWTHTLEVRRLHASVLLTPGVKGSRGDAEFAGEIGGSKSSLMTLDRVDDLGLSEFGLLHRTEN